MAAKAKKRSRERRQAAHRGGHGRPAAIASTRGTMPNLPDWRWRSFPVLVAFVAGVLLGSFATAGRPDNIFGTIVRIAALFGVGYIFAHLIVTNTIVARRIRRHEEAAKRGEDTDDKWVDEVVHPDEGTSES